MEEDKMISYSKGNRRAKVPNIGQQTLLEKPESGKNDE
jgi:hypothetical protein